MRSWIILSAVLIVMAVVAPSFSEELPAHGVKSAGYEALQLVKEASPQIVFLAVLFINLVISLIDSNRNFMESLISTIILVAITNWGGFYKPLIDFLNAKM